MRGGAAQGLEQTFLFGMAGVTANRTQSHASMPFAL